MAAAPAAAELLELDLDQLVPATDNPRRKVGDVSELAASIKAAGVLEPIVAIRENGHFKIVAGARRHAAAKVAGLTKVPVVVRELDDQTRVAAMLIENLQRADLAPIEEAAAYRRLIDEFGLSQRELAAKVGVSQGQVSKRLQLLEIPKEAAAQLDSGGITVEEAVELARLHDDPKLQLKVFKQRGQVYGGLKRAVKDALEEKRAAAIVAAEEAKLAKQGLRIVTLVQKHRYGSPEPPARMIEISAAGGWDRLKLDPKTHADEPCHAVAVRSRYDDKVEIVYLCTDRKRHPKAKTDSERGRSSSSRPSAEQIAHRELAKVTPARRKFASELILEKKLSADDRAELLLDGLLLASSQEDRKNACRLLELDFKASEYGAALREYAGRGAAQRGRVEAAIAIATHETRMGIYWTWTDHARYLAMLERAGYEISPAERKKLPKAANR